MSSSKPYLIRALYEWITDNGLTPYLYIDTGIGNPALPSHLYDEVPLVLNVSPAACHDLQMDNEIIHFQARFSGKVHHLSLPVEAVMAIVARENGQGMTFDTPSPQTDADTSAEQAEQEALPKDETSVSPKKKSGLRIVE